eukprot:4438821-Lingulodinium_polyedra.AAC.1
MDRGKQKYCIRNAANGFDDGVVAHVPNQGDGRHAHAHASTEPPPAPADPANASLHGPVRDRG